MLLVLVAMLRSMLLRFGTPLWNANGRERKASSIDRRAAAAALTPQEKMPPAMKGSPRSMAPSRPVPQPKPSGTVVARGPNAVPRNAAPRASPAERAMMAGTPLQMGTGQGAGQSFKRQTTLLDKLAPFCKVVPFWKGSGRLVALVFLIAHAS